MNTPTAETKRPIVVEKVESPKYCFARCRRAEGETCWLCHLAESARPGSRSSDHLVLPHVPDLVGGAAEPLAIDRLGIRAENRGAFQRDLAVRHPQRPTRHDDRPTQRMRDLLHHPALMQIRVVH